MAINPFKLRQVSILACAVAMTSPALAQEAQSEEGQNAEIEKIISTVDELPPELMLKSDATAVIGRRMLQAMMDAEREEKGSL